MSRSWQGQNGFPRLKRSRKFLDIFRILSIDLLDGGKAARGFVICGGHELGKIGGKIGCWK